MNLIYLDHASTTPVREEVLTAMLPYFCERFGNPSSLYSLGQEASDVVEAARGTLSRVLNTQPREIFFTSGGTESDNWAIKGFARAHASKGKHIITTAIEHHAVLHACEALEREGFTVTYLPVDEYGLVSAAAFKAAIQPDTILASVMFANNEIGTIEPISELAQIAHAAGVVFHTDAVQAFCHEPIDVEELGVDMLSASSHKIYGPKGVGLLYVRRGIKLQNLLDGGQQEHGKRGSTENVVGIVGFAEAARLAQTDLVSEHARQLALRDHAIKRILAEIPSAKLNGSWEHRLANNVNFSFEFIEGEGMLLQLAAQGICASSGSACTSGSLDPSHVLLAIGLPHEIAHGSLRMTIGRSTSQANIDQAIDALKAILTNLRMMSPLYEDYCKGKTGSIIAELKAAGFPYAN